MVYEIPDSTMEWLRDSHEEEYDYDPNTSVSGSLQSLLKWMVHPESPAPIDEINCVLVYYREDVYDDWVESGRPQSLTEALLALEYLTSIIDCEVPDTYSPNLYYPDTIPPDFNPPATVREFLVLRVTQLVGAPNYESEVLRAGSQYTAVRIIKRRGPLYRCFDNAAYMTLRYGLVYVECFAPCVDLSGLFIMLGILISTVVSLTSLGGTGVLTTMVSPIRLGRWLSIGDEDPSRLQR